MRGHRGQKGIIYGEVSRSDFAKCKAVFASWCKDYLVHRDAEIGLYLRFLVGGRSSGRDVEFIDSRNEQRDRCKGIGQNNHEEDPLCLPQ